MHITYDNIETFDEAVEHLLQEHDDIYKRAFANYDKETQHKIILNDYPDIKIKSSDHFTL